jgi:6-phosphogluconolactonase
MNFQRRHTFKLLSLTLALSAAFPALAHHDEDDSLRSGKVFTSTNSTSGNELLVYAPADNGGLNLMLRVPTQGQGSGKGLGSQGAVTLSGDGRYAFVVNALSNTLTTFAVREHGLQVTSVVSTGGIHPISVTEHDGIVFVLNDGGTGNVVGMRNERGELRAVPGATQPLSASSGTAPAQVGFSADGDVLVVSEKGSNQLTTYRVADNGRISPPHRHGIGRQDTVRLRL